MSFYCPFIFNSMCLCILLFPLMISVPLFSSLSVCPLIFLLVSLYLYFPHSLFTVSTLLFSSQCLVYSMFHYFPFHVSVPYFPSTGSVLYLPVHFIILLVCVICTFILLSVFLSFLLSVTVPLFSSQCVCTFISFYFCLDEN